MVRPLLAVILVLVAVLALYFGVGSQLQDRWRVQTTRTLPATVSALQQELGDLQRWRDWCGIEVRLGPTTHCQASGTAGSSEQAMTWRGSEGTLVLQLNSYDPARGLGYDLRLQLADGRGGHLGKGGIGWTPVEGGTSVTWFEEGVFDSLPARWSGWFGALQEHVRQNQEQSLARLAQHLEASR